jgi:hypothetical protein
MLGTIGGFQRMLPCKTKLRVILLAVEFKNPDRADDMRLQSFLKGDGVMRVFDSSKNEDGREKKHAQLPLQLIRFIK